MRILHIITGLASGGAERTLYKLLEMGLGEKGSSEVLSLQGEGVYGPRLRALGVPVHSLDMHPRFPSPRALAKLAGRVRKFEPGIIQGWMYHGNLVASLGAWLAPRSLPVAWNIRQSLYGLRYEKHLTRHVIRGNRILSGNVEAIIYNSQLSRIQHRSFGLADSRAIVIPNGFDLDQLRPDAENRAAVRSEFGILANEIVVGHVARFHPMKDHASFLRAAVTVARQHPWVRFLLVGWGVALDNPALAGIVPPEFLEQFVFAGERTDSQRLMQAMDVVASSSAWGEAFPNVLGEAMASGVPCVATDVGDSAEILGDTGIVVPPLDTDALAGALERMLEKSLPDLHALGRAARERIRTHYDLNSVVGKYVDLYEALSVR